MFHFEDIDENMLGYNNKLKLKLHSKIQATKITNLLRTYPNGLTKF